MRRTLTLVVAALAAAVPGQKAPGEHTGISTAAGALAPVGRWYTMGGSASRAGAGAQRPAFTGKLAKTWEHTADGEIEEEPLVWDDRVVLATRVSDKERRIHVLALADGRPLLPPRKVASELPLGLSIWGRLVAFREGSNTLRVEQIGANAFTVRTRVTTKGGVSAPLLFGSELYYTQGGRAERFELGAQQPSWSTDDRLTGRVSLLGDQLFVTRLSNPTEPVLVVLDRHTGKSLHREISALRWVSTTKTEDIAVAVGPGSILVWQAREPNVPGVTEQSENAVCFVREGNGARGVASLPLHAPPAFYDRRLMVLSQIDTHRSWVLWEPGPRLVMVVANEKQHPTFVAQKIAPLVLRDTACVGDYAFDADTLEILWRDGLQPSQRAVPARETLLVASGKVLRALRAHDIGAAKGAGGAAQAAGSKGLAVLRDGRVMRGEVAVEPATSTLSVVAGRKGETFALDGVMWAEEGDKAVHWGMPADVEVALDRLTDEVLGAGYVELARRAVRTNDAPAIARLLSQALLLGAEETQVTPAVRALEGLRRNPQRVNAPALTELAAEEVKVRARAADVPWRRFAALPPSAPTWLKTLLVETTLDLDPRHPAAVAGIRARLQAGTPTPEPFDAKGWLAFADARDQVPMTVVTQGTAGYEQELAVLDRARASWRKDLMLVCTDRMFVLAPPSTIGAVARCLSTGEVVLDALQSMFEGIGTRPASSERLRIQLYETREEYLDKAAGELVASHKAEEERRKAAGETSEEEEGDEPAKPMTPEEEKRAMGLQWTLGVFSPLEKITRLFVPAGKEAFADVVGTFAHEVTHHWLDVRGPRVETPEKSLPRLSRRGYWIVEGFASFVQDFVWDLEARRWRTVNPRSERLDMMANVPAAERVGWNTQLSVSQVGFHTRLSKRSSVPVVRSHYLGGYATSEAAVFYAQAAATCAYLFHAEDGKLRRSLLDYVVHWYSGIDAMLTAEAAFSLNPGQLGSRVVEYAQKAVAN